MTVLFKDNIDSRTRPVKGVDNWARLMERIWLISGVGGNSKSRRGSSNILPFARVSGHSEIDIRLQVESGASFIRELTRQKERSIQNCALVKAKVADD